MSTPFELGKAIAPINPSDYSRYAIIPNEEFANFKQTIRTFTADNLTTHSYEYIAARFKFRVLKENFDCISRVQFNEGKITPELRALRDFYEKQLFAMIKRHYGQLVLSEIEECL